MRVFVFLLMMTVAVGGLLGGYRAITGRNLVSLSDLGVGRADAQAVDASIAPRVPVPSPISTVPPLPTIAPAATPTPQRVDLVVVANTDGLGVFLRRTPRLDDRLRAWMEGARMEVLERGVEGDGRQWLKVRAPDGTVGYIPQEFVTPVQ